ncbi:flavonol sulfotransferase-like protein [Tanacetum coccineum]
MSTERDDQEKTHQEHAKLITKLPKADGWFEQHVYLYQGNWLLSTNLLSVMLMQKHFKHRTSDIFLVAFMKSGTTWLRSLMFTILNRSQFDFLDHPLLNQGPHEVFPAFDLYLPQDYPMTNVDVLPSPRDSKRCLSKFLFMQKLRPKTLPPISFDQAFELFCEGVSEFGPYWDRVLGFWRASLESPNKILFLKYEEIMKEPEVHVKRLADFLGVPISAEEEENGVVEKIAKFCSFEHLKNLEVNKTGVQRFDSGFIFDRV